MRRTVAAGTTRSVLKYLERYACPEEVIAAALFTQSLSAQTLPFQYEAVLIVPAFQESAEFLRQCVDACAGADGAILCIVVVNATAESQESSWPENSELLRWLQGQTPRRVSDCPPAWWGPLPVVQTAGEKPSRIDVLVVDRASETHVLPNGEGVGLARKIGCDIAVSLWAAGQLRQPWLYCTDADASLPRGYFDVEPSPRSRVVARLLPFSHAPGTEGREVDHATTLYELQLRYYVLSLANAGSPYGYHTIGSTIVVHAEAYCAVRGFPRRLAGEDFHLLNKLAKIGNIVAQRPSRAVVAEGQLPVGTGAIALRSRTSLRTVHGTGVAVTKLLGNADDSEHTLYNPLIFEELAVWLQHLEQFSVHRDVDKLRAALVEHNAPSISESLTELGVWKALQAAAAATKTQTVLLRRLHEWFDALKTLRFVHLLQSRGYQPTPWRKALGSSHWAVGLDPNAEVSELSERLATLEQQLEIVRGVSAHLERANCD